MKRQTIMALGGLLAASLTLATACHSTLDLAVETTPAPTPTVLLSPTASPTQASVGAFPYTDAWVRCLQQ